MPNARMTNIKNNTILTIACPVMAFFDFIMFPLLRLQLFDYYMHLV